MYMYVCIFKKFFFVIFILYIIPLKFHHGHLINTPAENYLQIHRNVTIA